MTKTITEIEDYSQKEIDFVIATNMGDNKLESFRIYEKRKEQ